MRFVVSTLLLFCITVIPSNVKCCSLSNVRSEDIKNNNETYYYKRSVEITNGGPVRLEEIYQDILRLRANCNGLDTCLERRTHDTLEQYHCDCGRYCGLFGTCCVDSIYRNEYPNPLKNVKCQLFKQKHEERSHELSYIDTCDSSLEVDQTTVDLCYSRGQDFDDPFLELPVTDPLTGITYRNYYCFACNENYGAEHPVPWNVVLEGETGTEDNSSIAKLHFDSSKSEWVIRESDGHTSTVLLSTYYPDELIDKVHYCTRYKVTDCATNWTDDWVRAKCSTYMALVKAGQPSQSYPGINIYRTFQNPHCAICNYQVIDGFVCDVRENYYQIVLHHEVLFVGLFSMADKKEKCEENMTYDFFAKKCRKVFKAKRKSG